MYVTVAGSRRLIQGAVTGRSRVGETLHEYVFRVSCPPLSHSLATFADPRGNLGGYVQFRLTMSIRPALCRCFSFASLAQVAPKLRSNLAQKFAVGVFGVGFLMLFVNVSRVL